MKMNAECGMRNAECGIRKIFFLTAYCLLLTAYCVHAQEGEKKAKELFEIGMKNFQGLSYKNAMASFKASSEVLPENKYTRYAHFFCGLTQYHLHEYAVTITWFNKVIAADSLAPLAQEAMYHKALSLYYSHKTEQGLNELWRLSQLQNKSLAVSAFNAHQEILYTECSLDFVKKFYAASSNTHRKLIVEVLLAKYYDLSEFETIRDLLKNISAEEGESSIVKTYKNVFAKGQNISSSSENFRVSLMLPLYLNQVDTSKGIANQSRMALEFYEGVRTAAVQYNKTHTRKILLHIIDVTRDLTFVPDDFNKDNFLLASDAALGPVFNAPYRAVSVFFEKNATASLNPFSSDITLVEQKPHCFLANASVASHGAFLAKYIQDSTRFKNIVVISDTVSYSKLLASGFVNQMKMNPLYSVKEFSLDSGSVYLRLNDIISQIVGNSVEAIYAPLYSDVAFNYLMGALNGKNYVVPIYASPDIENFTTLSPEMLERFQVSFTSDFMIDINSPDAVTFRKAFRELYSTEPGEYAYNGYDLMQYLIFSFTNQKAGENLSETIKRQDTFAGIHTKYFYKGKNDNQYVHILRYSDDSVIQLTH